MSIYVPASVLEGIQRGTRQSCLKIEFRGHEISIASDDSCGAHTDLRRSEIRIYKDNKDVTIEIFGHSLLTDSDDLFAIMEYLAS